MVCKEDVLSWFKDLESYKRIDVMYELLNMCVPFEVRFLGTCVEEIGKHSYQELRGPAIIANDVEKLSKDTSLNQGLLDEHSRHRVLLYISLLSARNCICANWFYKTLFRTDWLEDYIVKGNCKDDIVQSELILLFTMSLHHPAFTFDQKQFLGRMLSLLIEQRERESRVPPKPNVLYSHPPGLMYPAQKVVNIPDAPVKAAPAVPHGDSVLHHGHPPGLAIPAVPPPPLDLLTTLYRPGFVGTVCGAPEVAPFPPPPVSPLVSQAGSPTASRSTSPHRTMNMRPPPVLPPPNRLVESMAPVPQLPPIDSLSHSSLPPLFNSDIKLPDEELNHMQEEKPWPSPMVLPIDPKPINGIRFTPYTKLPQSFLLDQMQALNLDGENSLHHSNSSSSSSLNHSPPDTPTVPPHGPGRGESKRVNGIPVFMNPVGGPTLCDSTPPPPPLPAFTNCSVPYSNYPAQVPLPNRSVFQYAQTYRTPFTTPTPFPYQPTDSVYSTYTVPYVSYVYSSPQGAQFPPRSPYCYNCGASGHLGTDCSGQTIEDITEKQTYALEYASPLPDAEK